MYRLMAVLLSLPATPALAAGDAISGVPLRTLLLPLILYAVLQLLRVWLPADPVLSARTAGWVNAVAALVSLPVAVLQGRVLHRDVLQWMAQPDAPIVPVLAMACGLLGGLMLLAAAFMLLRAVLGHLLAQRR